MAGKHEEGAGLATNPHELFRGDPDRSDARCDRALADDVDVGQLGAKALGHLKDLLVDGAEEQLVLRSPLGSLRLRFHDPLPLDDESAGGNTSRSELPSV